MQCSCVALRATPESRFYGISGHPTEQEAPQSSRSVGAQREHQSIRGAGVSQSQRLWHPTSTSPDTSTPEGVLSKLLDHSVTNISKAGLHSVRVAVFHINNVHAQRKTGNVKAFVTEVLAACALHQVDILGGDGNAATYKFKNNQRHPDIGNSILSTYVRRFVSVVNAARPFHARVRADMFYNNSIVELLAGEDLDCMFVTVFHWGRSTAAQFIRTGLMTDPATLPHVPSRRGHAGQIHPSLRPHKGIREGASVLDSARQLASQFLSSMEGVDLADPFMSPIDFDIQQSHRLLHLDNRSLWLRDSDTGWHLPVMLTLREVVTKNWRQRTRAGQEARDETREEYRDARQAIREYNRVGASWHPPWNPSLQERGKASGKGTSSSKGAASSSGRPSAPSAPSPPREPPPQQQERRQQQSSWHHQPQEEPPSSWWSRGGGRPSDREEHRSYEETEWWDWEGQSYQRGWRR